MYGQTKKYFQQQVNFKIQVTLNDQDKTLDGFEEFEYYNNSPDTLNFIWIHLWPNAYKNDRTSFSEQFLKNGRTDFYFSSEKERGYINRLVFKSNGALLKTVDSSAIDIMKLFLDAPLLPGKMVKISTPFHEKIPFNFSRGGYSKGSFQITQWYPKPAVYDKYGWHPMSYLDQGEFYSEFGSYDVAITIPQEYIVAATGELKDESEKKKLKLLCEKLISDQTPVHESRTNNKSSDSINNKTLHYYQDNVHDFAWFANKKFIVQHDTFQLLSGRIIDAWVFFNKQEGNIWSKSLNYIKESIQSRSRWLGEYPYNVITVVEGNSGISGGMEYPTITSISSMPSARYLETIIEHEVGHNWNYGILATNERLHPWMDEGINSYFDRRFLREGSIINKDEPSSNDFIAMRIPNDLDHLFYLNAIKEKRDQPIETPSELFSELNYNIIAYHKTALWLELLENFVGRKSFDSALHKYYESWKFQHPYPEDFKQVVKEYSTKNVDSVFDLIKKRGGMTGTQKRVSTIIPFITFRKTDLYNYNFILPAIGYNFYDGLMGGMVLHNFTLPSNNFQYLIAPLYTFKNKGLNGLGRFQYHWSTYGKINLIQISLSSAKFSSSSFTDSVGNKTALTFVKLTPSIKIFLKENDPRSTRTKFIQWKTFFLRERNVLFARDTFLQKDIITYPYSNSYINQLKFVVDNHRALYPYRSEFQIEQGISFAKATFTGKYLFNYKNGGGLNVRFFAGKFIYLGEQTISKHFATERYHLNLTGANGYEDYTFSNYFIGRNEFEKWPSQQIMIRDGGFKVRSDLLSSKIGKTDNWLSTLNFQSDVPKNINPLQLLPIKIPLEVFFDIGTYANQQNTNSVGTKFLFDAGFQISLIKNIINIYVPIAYSKVYSDYFKSTYTTHRFLKTISFSIDLQNINLRKFNPQVLL